MALHHDLLEQAFHLALRETKKPKQASLRRSVSAAYYALFHLLAADGSRLLAPPQPGGLRLLIGRAFDHGQMRQVCKGLVEGNAAVLLARQPGNRSIPPTTRALLTFPFDPSLVLVLQAFVDLQEARHQADYDTGRHWNRVDVLRHVEKARQAFAGWANVRKTGNASVLLAALLLQREWVR